MLTLVASSERSLLLFGGVLFLVQLGCFEIGHRVGRNNRTENAEKMESVGVVVGAMLGLLAFVLALTLSFANERFSERQAGSLAEANAIGTAWLRAKAVGGPEAEAIAGLLEEYARVRRDFVHAGRDLAAVDGLTARTDALQSAIWAHLTKIVREKPDDISGSLMEALNAMFDASAAERFAFHLWLPSQVFWLLMVMTLVSMACLGYQLGLKGVPQRVLVASLILMWTAVIIGIVDLAAARLGSLRAGTTAYDWTLQGFGGAPSPRP